MGGRYRVLERLGAGGQGAVWRAHDERLRRDVAIKIARSERSGSPDARWLAQEARTLGAFAHPGIVSVFDLGLCSAAAFGADDDALVVYVVLELVDGSTLREWIAARRPSVAEIHRVFGDIAAGLHAVHAQGLVHCDVKPANVLVSTSGGGKLADFGLAYVANRGGPEHDETTLVERATPDTANDRWVVGTPLYMPPEQFRGRRVDARADQYALAATWFEALFGQPPHRGREHGTLLLAKLEGAPVRPSSLVPRRSYAALARALDPDPQRRFPDVAAFAQAVRAGGRRRWWVPASVAALGLAGAIGVALHDPPRPGCTPDELADTVIVNRGAGPVDGYAVGLEQRFRDGYNAQLRRLGDARRSACASDRSDAVLACIARVQQTIQTALAPESVHTRRDVERGYSVLALLPDPQACLDQPSAELATIGYDEDDIAAASRALVLANEHMLADRFEATIAAADEAARHTSAEQLFANEIALTRAHALVSLDRFDEAAREFQQVWDRALANDAALDAARAAEGLATVVGTKQRDFEAGMRWVSFGRSQLARVGGLPAYEAALHSAAGLIHIGAGDRNAALAELDLALALLREVPDQESALLTVLENASLMRLDAGQHDAAEAGFREVLARSQKSFGPTHPKVARAYLDLSYLEHERGRLERADEMAARAIEVYTADPLRQDFELARMLGFRAGLAVERGDLQSALVAALRADEICEQVLPADHPERARGVSMVLDVLVRMEDLDRVEAFAESRRATIARVLESDEEPTVGVAENLARVAGMRGRFDEAIRLFRIAIETAERRRYAVENIVEWCAIAATLAAETGDLAGAAKWTARGEENLARFGSSKSGRELLEQVRAALAATRATEQRRK